MNPEVRDVFDNFLAGDRRQGWNYHGSYADPAEGRASPGDNAGFFTSESPDHAAWYANSEQRNEVANSGHVYAVPPPKNPLDVRSEEGARKLLASMREDAQRIDDAWMNTGEGKSAHMVLRALDRAEGGINEGDLKKADAGFREAAIEMGRVRGREGFDSSYLNEKVRDLGHDAYVTTESHPERRTPHKVTVYMDRPDTETLFQGAPDRGQPKATSKAVEFAKEKGLDLAEVEGTGVGGRVTKRDVQDHLVSSLSPEEKVAQGIHYGRVQRGKQEVGYSDERSRRFAAAKAARQREDDPIEGHYAAKAELRGELPKIQVGGKLATLDHDALRGLFTTINEHPYLMEGQKTRARDALLRIVEEGRVPAKNELNLLQHVFGRDTAQSLVHPSNLSLYKKLLSVLNIPRAVMASFDLSAPFRQGLVAGARHPRIFARNFAPMLKSFRSEGAYETIMGEIKARQTYPMMEQAKLSFTDLGEDLTNREEQFFSNIAENLTGGTHSPIRMSGRAYTGFLNKMRADVFDHLMRVAAAQGRNVQDEKLLLDVGHHINNMTGRGQLPGKALQEASTLFNTLFFSPRLFASRVHFLNLNSYLNPNIDPFVRKEALRASLQLAGAAATVLGVAGIADGVTVNLDPRNADFAKIRHGNTRLDVLGGFQQPIRVASQLIKGEVVSSTTGKKMHLQGGTGNLNRLDITGRFVEGKLAPIPSIVTDWLKHSDFQGKPFSWKQEAVQHITPLIAQDVSGLYQEQSGGMNGIAAALAGYGVGAFGFGLQSYGPKGTADDHVKTLTEDLQHLAAETPQVLGGEKIPPHIIKQIGYKAQLDHAIYTSAENQDGKIEWDKAAPIAAHLYDQILGSTDGANAIKYMHTVGEYKSFVSEVRKNLYPDYSDLHRQLMAAHNDRENAVAVGG